MSNVHGMIRSATPQGNLSAIGTLLSKSGFTQSFTEHGIIIGLANIRADLNYQQGMRRMWPFGFSSIGAVTFDSAAYVARYILKKQLGKGAADFYSSIGRVPEYTVMSRRPGIAHDWFELYHDDVYPSDEVIVKNHKVKPPRYYDLLFDIHDHEGFTRIKARRRGAAVHSEMSDIDRRLVKEQIKLARIKTLTRAIEI